MKAAMGRVFDAVKATGKRLSKWGSILCMGLPVSERNLHLNEVRLNEH